MEADVRRWINERNAGRRIAGLTAGHHGVTTGFDGDHWSAASEAVGYGVAGEVTGGPAGAPESGTPA